MHLPNAAQVSMSTSSCLAKRVFKRKIHVVRFEIHPTKWHSKLFRVIHLFKTENTQNIQLIMIQSEDREIDRALELCKLIQSDLLSCVGIVQRLDRKYNEPDRYRIDVKPFHLDPKHVRQNNSSTLSNLCLARSSNVSMSMLSLASCASVKVEGRSSHELNAIFVDLKSKCIKLRRELEATAAHAQRITDCSLRQERVQHRMLRDAQTSKTLICKHWGNNLNPRTSSKRMFRLKD
ncbi:uncharacterized protein LOC117786625 [Drosophila innubila]|uniref:uncharacterized protein LOC117786625 n=1 Tax=Drosophila innubila TaxID=198719 RepID=UPI00148E81D0|nr:uncharacterized protein LOC117786625 [Drosophila innubila]